VGLIGRAIEARGVPTVAVAVRRGLIARVRPPRALVTGYPNGQTVGPPGDDAAQRAVLRRALALLTATEPGTIVDLGASDHETAPRGQQR